LRLDRGVSGGRGVGPGVGVASLKYGDFGFDPRALFLLPAVRWSRNERDTGVLLIV
jgi:hypothetical protein